uniref:Poor homologous synapsis 1 PH domain-containing protein n=1 Tax=Ananas comosus var. bracteatus TaxID=296719 RepID=A0A6V7QIF7_ANACO|nr:unnamed protein product [Ananas comosus var. bracteatus]
MLLCRSPKEREREWGREKRWLRSRSRPGGGGNGVSGAVGSGVRALLHPPWRRGGGGDGDALPAAARSPLGKRKRPPTKGSWLAASSAAVLSLAKRRSADAASILSVSVGDDLYVRLFLYPAISINMDHAVETLEHFLSGDCEVQFPLFECSKQTQTLSYELSVDVAITFFYGQEEHFVSNLHFSWPQVSCVAECPVRGSRVVFFSYRDSSSQIQKFAVRFASYSIVEAFLSCVKDCLRDVMDIALPGNDLVCENSSLSEYTASNGLHYKFDEESSFEKPIAAYPLNMRASSDNGERSQQSLQPEFDNNIETFSSGLPPSFTELLHNSLTYTREEQPNPKTQTNRALCVGHQMDSTCSNIQIFKSPRSGYANDGSKETSSMEVGNLKSQIAKYMTDASFLEMLFKLEKVINEVGGDLSL